MVKFELIFLFVLVFIVCQINASSFISPNSNVEPRAAKDRVVNIINKTVEEVKETVNKLKVLVMDTIESAKDIAEESSLKLIRENSQIISQVNDIINRNRIFSTKCENTISVFQDAYEELKIKSNNCVDNYIQRATENFYKINTVARVLFVDLAAVTFNILNCASETTSVFQTFKCNNLSELKAAFHMVPYVTSESRKLSAKILLLPSQMGYCYSTQFISTVRENYSNAMTNLKQCLTKC